MPPSLERGLIPYQAPYLEIGPAFLLGLFQDETDVQYVRLYDLVKSEDEGPTS